MKKILLVGNGAREQAIAQALKRSRGGVELYVIGKSRNPGILPLAKEYVVGDIGDSKFVVEFAQKFEVDFGVIGPEDPIARGVVDALLEVGVKCCSPLRELGKLEWSKGFTRDLLTKHGIFGNPLYRVFQSEKGLREFFEELGENFVVKADGLKGGKGVMVSGDHLHGMEEGIAYALECLEDSGSVVVEEKLVGEEFSLMSFCDGVTTISMPCIRDHKRAYEGDKGPNTGGMGTYSCANHLLPYLTAEDVAAAEEITRQVAGALREECGSGFKGVMYGGFMKVADGVRLIEYNARFGDPEAMNALSLLESDFVELCEAIIEGRLDQCEVRFATKATVCKYVVPEGYPDDGVKGVAIEIGEVPEGVGVFYASVDLAEDGQLILGGSRAVAFVGVGADLAEAEKLAEAGASSVKGPVFYRKDIGKN